MAEEGRGNAARGRGGGGGGGGGAMELGAGAGAGASPGARGGAESGRVLLLLMGGGGGAGRARWGGAEASGPGGAEAARGPEPRSPPAPDYEALPQGAAVSTHMLAGAVAGIMEHCVMYPIDCVKVPAPGGRPGLPGGRSRWGGLVGGHRGLPVCLSDSDAEPAARARRPLPERAGGPVAHRAYRGRVEAHAGPEHHRHRRGPGPRSLLRLLRKVKKDAERRHPRGGQ